jgi:hypothetical protein
MSKDSDGFYAMTRWHPDDVKELRPKWSKIKCEAWLAEHEQYICDRSVECGWDVIESLLSDESK